MGNFTKINNPWKEMQNKCLVAGKLNYKLLKNQLK